MSTIETIRCRAKLDDDCYDDSPMSRQIPGDAPSSPYHVSSLAMMKIAQAEVDRRAGVSA